MKIRYFPFESPFVPRTPKGIYWVPREFQYAPYDEHVKVFMAHVEPVSVTLSCKPLPVPAGVSSDVARLIESYNAHKQRLIDQKLSYKNRLGGAHG